MKGKITATVLLLGTLWSGAPMLKAQSVFVPANATYNGIFYEADGTWSQSAGSMVITTTSKGKYTAKIVLGPNKYSFSGQFYPDGSAYFEVLQYYQPPLVVRFHVDVEDPDLIYGTVTDGYWVSELTADRAVYDGNTSICPDAGKYTMVIPGDFNSLRIPGGESYGTITIEKNGKIKFSGSLADNTKVSQSTTVAKGGQWPLYIPVYSGQGALYSWMLFHGSPDEDLAGDVTWIKPEAYCCSYYPDGFAISVRSWGSVYVSPPNGTKVLDIAYGEIEFNGGQLWSNITNLFTLDYDNKINNQSANGLNLSFSWSNGKLSGKVQDPYTWQWTKFNGVVLQRQNVAAGYFLGWSLSGEMWLQGLR